ncbi:MAG TPA: hypothetical protein VFT64_10315 [Rickettsiales bacterium]|nr:hypothetical protein [Rickettsiales bacterium]
MNSLWNTFFKASPWQAAAKQADANWQLTMACWETIFYRTQMMGQALEGKIPFSHPEFTHMWQEKIMAVAEGNMAAASEIQSMFLKALANPEKLPRTTEKMLDTVVHQSSRLHKIASAPIHRKAKSNAKRLRKKSVK